MEVVEVLRRTLGRFVGEFGRKEGINVGDEYGLEPDRVGERVAETTTLSRIEKVKGGEF